MNDCSRFSATTPLCNTMSGACVGCLTKSDCLSVNKACNMMTGTCGACAANADCASNLCCVNGTLPNGNPCTTGSCVDPSSVVYVSSAGKSCPAGPGQGNLSDPYCTIGDGITAAAAIASNTVVVLSGTYGENLSIKPAASSMFKVYAVGINGPIVAPTTVGPALTIVLGGATQITANFDGFTFKNAVGASGHGINCTGGATPSTTTVKIVRSTISNNAQVGVNASNCDITLDEDVIGPMNMQGGILFSGTDYTLQNLQVAGNGTLDPSGSDAGGIKIATAAPSRKNMVNLTVVGNQNSASNGTASGIACTGSPVVFNSVMFGNVGGTPEVSGGCGPIRSAFSTPAATTNNFSTATCTNANQLFAISGGLYYPAKTIGSPCSLVLQTNNSTVTSLIGSGQAMSMPPGGINAPTYDLVGASRPSPPAIGALE